MMNCEVCREFIDPYTSSGAYICRNRHWQCEKCALGFRRQCRACRVRTNFVALVFDPAGDATDATIPTGNGIEQTLASLSETRTVPSSDHSKDETSLKESNGALPKKVLKPENQTCIDSTIDSSNKSCEQTHGSGSDLSGAFRLEECHDVVSTRDLDELAIECQKVHEILLEIDNLNSGSDGSIHDNSSFDRMAPDTMQHHNNVKPIEQDLQGGKEILIIAAKNSQSPNRAGHSKDRKIIDNEWVALELAREISFLMPPCVQEKFMVQPEPVTGFVKVSTASKSCLADFDCGIDPKKVGLSSKHPLTEYFGTPATDERKTANTLRPEEKFEKQSNIEYQMQKVLSTLHEEPCHSKKSDEPEVNGDRLLTNSPVSKSERSLEEHILEVNHILPSSSSRMSPPRERVFKEEGCDVAKQPIRLQAHSAVSSHIGHTGHTAMKTHKVVFGTDLPNVSHAHRACFRPHSDDTSTPQRYLEKMTPSIYSFCNEILTETPPFASRQSQAVPVGIIPCFPVTCPDTFCKTLIFVSDICEHMLRQHRHVPLERIAAGQHKNFFVNPEIAEVGIVRCNMMFLVRDMVKGLVNSRDVYKDLLPILVMSTRVPATDMCGGRKSAARGRATKASKSFVLIWLTGIAPANIPMTASLAVVSSHKPLCILTTSGELYTMDRPQTAKDVMEHANVLFLDPGEIRIFTKNGEKMLTLQILLN